MAWGLELRGWYYNVDKNISGSDSRTTSNYFFGAADFLIEGSIGDNIYWTAEGVLRHRTDNDELKCQFAKKGIYANLKQAFIEYEKNRILVRLGRQNLTFGNGMVLNHWFDAVELDWKSGRTTIGLFGGIFAVDAARSCQREVVFEHRACWKNFCSSEWGDQKAGGAFLSLKWQKRQHMSLMIMRQISPNSGGLSRSALFTVLTMRGLLPGGISYNFEAAWQKADQISDIMDNTWGTSLWLQKSLGIKAEKFHIRFGSLYGSGQDKSVFSPIFERIRWGERYHYSAHQELILGMKTKWIPSFTRYIEPKFDYFRNLDRNSFVYISDEIDAGLKIKLADSKQIWVVYSILNPGNDAARVNQFKIETRVVL